MRTNQHIHKFLNYYIEEVDQPEYAVLLSGKWGSGKTFFINQITEKYQTEKNIVKVSLFGLTSKEDIHKKVLLKLSNALWIELFSKYFITSQQITESLNKSRYFFREQKEEWVMLWHYMWIEEDEFQAALNQTLLKIEKK
jgi:predicted KAP-like P-loop ATPase